MWNETRSDTAKNGAAGVRQESPLVGVAELLSGQTARAAGLFSLRERPFCDLVNLRGDARDPAFAEVVAQATGVRLPVQPNTVARGAEYDALWLGPDEWLVRSLEPRPALLETRLTGALAGQFATAVDVGSGYTVLEAHGTRVRDVLARGCPLDLHPQGFAPGQCAQSHYFKASIVLVPVQRDAYELVVRRSFADYFCRMMLDAALPLVS
ncbi:MAG TPA: sarcosine oxidase subunit gamma [Paraburkholderia sp.]|jgi:sarcosine oxidase subunit gamma|nr:sarcosine oxidase subunit gamma [Paraburkholderia sp.]